MPVESRPGQGLIYNAKVNESFVTIAKKIELEAGIDDIPVTMHHVNLPIDCHAPLLIKNVTDKPHPPSLLKTIIFEAAANDYYADHIHIVTDESKNPNNGRVGFAVVEQKISRHPK